MFNTFYAKLALANIRRDKRTYVPQIIATAVISGVYLLIAGLMFSDGLANMTSGETTQAMFSLGMVVFSIFAFFFMLYVNNFLIGRRKREFGLYAVLGLEKRHVGRVLRWENLFTLGLGLILGIVCALIFGQLVFWILLRLIDCADGSRFVIGARAYAMTLVFFGGIFIVTSVYNTLRVRIANPMELIRAPKKGEKDSKMLWPLAILGVIMLAGAYYMAWRIDDSVIALGMFFPLVIVVIVATYIVMEYGSIAFLRAIKANKRIYYRPSSFIAISGMIQRMRQNARSLATICILSTMLVVTVSGTLSLYAGREEMLHEFNPHDVEFSIHFVDKENGYPLPDKAEQERIMGDIEQLLINSAAKHGVSISKEQFVAGEDDSKYCDAAIDLPGVDQRTGYAIMQDFYEAMDAYHEAYNRGSASGLVRGSKDIYNERAQSYAMYGGLLFMGVFFGMLFLAVTVLIIYFKQISEGYDDKAQFDILQKVGMDDRQVKATINSQVLWVFFIPLGMTLLHMLFASKIMSCMLGTFQLNDYALILRCIGATCAAFMLLYLIVYKLTARVYYRIVRW